MHETLDPRPRADKNRECPGLFGLCKDEIKLFFPAPLLCLEPVHRRKMAVGQKVCGKLFQVIALGSVCFQRICGVRGLFLFVHPVDFPGVPVLI